MANETVVRLGLDLNALRAGERMAGDIERRTSRAGQNIQRLGEARGVHHLTGPEERAHLDVLNSTDPAVQAQRRASVRARRSARARRLRSRAGMSGQAQLDRFFTPVNAVREKGGTAFRALTGASGIRGVGSLISIGAEGLPGLIGRGGPMFAAIGIIVGMLFDRLETDFKNELKREFEAFKADLEREFREAQIARRFREDTAFAREAATQVFSRRLDEERTRAAMGVRVDESQETRVR